jgi:hypothetical protein
VGAQVLDWSRAQVALMRPSRSSRALEAIIRDLIDTRDGATYFAERVWGVRSATISAAATRWWAAALPTSSWPTEEGSASCSRTGKACCWTLTQPPLQALASRWSDRITYVASDAKDRLG